jgi:hypothetical protein
MRGIGTPPRPDGTALPKRNGHLTSILVHKDAKW